VDHGTRRFKAALVAVVLGALTPGDASAGEAMLFGGLSTTDLRQYGVGWRFDDWKTFERGGNWRYTIGSEATFAYWRGIEGGAVDKELYDLGYTNTIRMTRISGGTPRPYLEGGLGVHVLSGVKINLDRDLGIAFQFGEFIGAGMRFGENERYSLAFRLAHESNANIDKPNNGLSIGLLVFTADF
jgi:hypothetical protein